MARVPIHRKGQPRPQTFALVDDEDCMRLGGFVWFLDGRGYVQRQEFPKGDRPRKIYLAREVMGLGMARDSDNDLVVDHINGDPLDNRRQNLRAVTRAQNSQNRIRRDGTSRYRGVSLIRTTGRWQAYGGRDGECFYLGTYATEEQAAAASRKWRLANLPYTNESRV